MAKTDLVDEDVANHTLMLLLACARKLTILHSELAAGRWRRDLLGQIPPIYGQTLGLVGFGHIGAAVARRGQVLGLEVLAYDPFVESKEMALAGVRKVQMGELLEREAIKDGEAKFSSTSLSRELRRRCRSAAGHRLTSSGDTTSPAEKHYTWCHLRWQLQRADSRILHEVICSAPVSKGLITMTGDLGFPEATTIRAVMVRAEDVPAGLVATLAERSNKYLPEDLEADGTIHGSLSMQENAAAGVKPHFEGTGEIADLRLTSP